MPAGNPGGYRKVNRSRSVARGKPYGTAPARALKQQPSLPKPGIGFSKSRSVSLPKPGAGFGSGGFSGSRPAGPKVGGVKTPRQPGAAFPKGSFPGSSKPKATGRPGMKRSPAPTKTTNRRKSR